MTTKDNIGVVHYVDGKDSWKLGFMGFLTRWRGHSTTILLGMPLMGVPFWWPDKWSQTWSISPTNIVSHCSVALVVLLVSAFFYLRHRSIRSLSIKAQLHEIAHHLRDGVSELFRRTSAPSGRPKKNDPRSEAKHIVDFANSVSDKARDYFRLLIGDQTIECAIRLAHEYPCLGGSPILKYRTVGRSSGLSAKRKTTSEPIPHNSGIPKFFRSVHDNQGILFYQDITTAISKDVFHKTKNEDHYPNDIITMMVAPLNGWDGNSNDMIGLVYITSRKSKVFNAAHVDAMKFIADSLAGAFVAMLGRLHSVGVQPELTDPNL